MTTRPIYAQGRAIVSTNPNKDDIQLYIRMVFKDKADDALKICFCESGFNANAQNSTSSATGLFQIVDGTWIANRRRMRRDPSLELKTNWIENVETANYIYLTSGVWPWLASNGCHGLIAIN